MIEILNFFMCVPVKGGKRILDIFKMSSGVLSRKLIFTSSCPTREEISHSTSAIVLRVTYAMNLILDKAYTQIEVENALKQMTYLKSSASDGFRSCFYQ